MNRTGELYQITAPHFCAGIIVRKGIAREAAPILKYAKGWTIQELMAYCDTKDWACLLVPAGVVKRMRGPKGLEHMLDNPVFLSEKKSEV